MTKVQSDLILDDETTAADLSHIAPDKSIVPLVPAVESINPLMLLEKAVEKGMDPAQLKALVDLHEQWRAARAKEAFSAAMNAVQAEMPCIVRDAYNKQTESTYIRLETLTHRARPIYTGHGFSLSFSEEDLDKDGWKRTACLVRHIEGHSERHFIDLPVDGIGPKGNAIGGMNKVQGAISTGTYAQRILTCRIFNLVIADSDLDGNVQHDNPALTPEAVRVPPRGRRETAATEVTPDNVKYVKGNWQGESGNQSGNVETDRRNFVSWVQTICRREFDPLKVSQWTKADIIACCGALGIMHPWEDTP